MVYGKIHNWQKFNFTFENVIAGIAWMLSETMVDAIQMDGYLDEVLPSPENFKRLEHTSLVRK